MDWKNRYCLNNQNAQGNLQIQSNFYQNANSIFFIELEQIIINLCVETQKTLNCQNDPEKEDQSWKDHTLGFQTILQSYIRGNGMVPVQKHRSTEKNTEPRNEPALIWAINLQQRRQEYTVGERHPLQ